LEQQRQTVMRGSNWRLEAGQLVTAKTALFGQSDFPTTDLVAGAPHLADLAIPACQVIGQRQRGLAAALLWTGLAAMDSAYQSPGHLRIAPN
jgi:hypothetical protein